MTNILFKSPDGTVTTIAAEDGDSVMQVAVANDVDGIIGECGGAMMCATCHCYVDEASTDKTGPLLEGEDEMLECTDAEVRPTSRLSCQIKVSPQLEGVIFEIPEA